MVNFGFLTAEICWRVWGTPANSNGFHVLAALLHGTIVVWASAKLCGVEQRAPPIFGRATTTLGIGPHSSFKFNFLWTPCVADADIIFLPCGFFILLSSIFYLLYSSPNLSRRRLDVCHTSTHGVALVRIYDASLKRTARCSLKYRTQKIAI